MRSDSIDNMAQHTDKKKTQRLWSLERGVPLTGVLVLFVLGVVISAVVYGVMHRLLYDQYNDKLTQVATYVANNTDADDLAQCIATGQSSAKRDQLQGFVNDMVDDLGLAYIYIVIPEVDRMVNVVSSTNHAEVAAGETDMALLEPSYAYSSQELARFRACLDSDTIRFFEETSQYGTYYTACMPLRDSTGNTVALLCVDESSIQLHHDLRLVTLLAASILALLVITVGVWLLVLLRNKAIRPIAQIARSTRDFADHSAGTPDLEQLRYEAPAIHTLELHTLVDAIAKMATNMRDYVDRIVQVEQQAVAAEEENIRLAEQARAQSKIDQLTESINSLFANMPAMAFSKDMRTGRYLACNQLFADYVHKPTPADVVGLVDADMFDAATARRFVQMDAIVVAMDGPYVYVEDFTDPDGNPRQFQTTKIKFTDSQGRLCILGMCLDTTELMVTRQQSQAAQAAYLQARDASLTYASIARALAMDYFYLYYVDLQTNGFLEYRSDRASEDIVLERRGEDFFAQSIKDAHDLIYPADLDAFLNAFDKDNILDTIDRYGMFTLSYRLLVQGAPAYVNMKITRMVDDPNHLVVGINNVDAQMRIQEEVERAREERSTFARITALAGNYICIYTVDPTTDHYVEYNVSPDYEHLGLAKAGDDFFGVARRESATRIYAEDVDRFLASFDKEQVLAEVQSNGVFALEYRLLLGGVPTYVRIKAALVEEVDGLQLVVGISNIDKQVKHEQEYAQRLRAERAKANIDALTGLQNKHAYIDHEAELDREIEASTAADFAVVVLDINGLKQINDTQGHTQGDALIVSAAQAITAVFVHCPVYRVGGDEFVVIVSGDEYDDIDNLLQHIATANTSGLAQGGVVIACGMSRYNRNTDTKVATVFERADSNMYRNKRKLKLDPNA